MLHEIESVATIYNIHYCNAGVGIQFYEESRDPKIFETQTVAGIEMQKDVGWRKGLVIYKYYPTFEDAVKGEYERLKQEVWMAVANWEDVGATMKRRSGV